jgi:hypothetical protein
MSISIHGTKYLTGELVEGPQFSNDNFIEVMRLLGFDVKLEGSIDGGELEILKSRIQTVLHIISQVPDQFQLETEIQEAQGKATVSNSEKLLITTKENLKLSIAFLMIQLSVSIGPDGRLIGMRRYHLTTMETV